MAAVERDDHESIDRHIDVDGLRRDLNRAFDVGDKALHTRLGYEIVGTIFQQRELIDDLSAEVEKLRLTEGDKELIFHFTYDGQDYIYDDTWGELVCDDDRIFLLQNQRVLFSSIIRGKNRGRTHKGLIELMWPGAGVTENTTSLLTSTAFQLRDTLGSFKPELEKSLLTLYGIGYKLDVDVNKIEVLSNNDSLFVPRNTEEEQERRALFLAAVKQGNLEYVMQVYDQLSRDSVELRRIEGDVSKFLGERSLDSFKKLRLSSGGVEFCFNRNESYFEINGKSVSIRPLVAELLGAFLGARGYRLNNDFLASKLWPEEPDRNKRLSNLRMYMTYLRTNLEDVCPGLADHMLTIKGVGYIWDVKVLGGEDEE